MKRLLMLTAGLFLSLTPALAGQAGEVTAVSVLPGAGSVHVVIDVRGDVRVTDFTLNRPARLVIDAHRLREHERIRRVCREAAFPEPELAADQFYMLLEGAKACVQCIGLKRVGEHLVRSVDASLTTMISKSSVSRGRTSRARVTARST